MCVNDRVGSTKHHLIPRQTQLKLVYFGYESIFEWELLHIDQNHHRAHGSEWRDQIYTSGPFNDPTQWDRRVELYEFHPVVNDNDSYVDEDMITSQYAKTKKVRNVPIG